MNDLKERLMSKIIKNEETGCWEWTAALRVGYGVIKWKGRSQSAHRLSFEVFNHPIEDGMFICHRCDNPKCINPDHLFQGTPRDNAMDAVKKGRFYNVETEGREFRFKEGNVPFLRNHTKEELEAVLSEIEANPDEPMRSVCRRMGFNYQSFRDYRRKGVYAN